MRLPRHRIACPPPQPPADLGRVAAHPRVSGLRVGGEAVVTRRALCAAGEDEALRGDAGAERQGLALASVLGQQALREAVQQGLESALGLELRCLSVHRLRWVGPVHMCCSRPNATVHVLRRVRGRVYLRPSLRRFDGVIIEAVATIGSSNCYSQKLFTWL